ncbi:phosphoglycerate mutase-like protein [Microstroma glucosiphilum]|uniref:Phosphoglycerate mutase-like protein n=1 Tax=Pseudomicrostroma glucosiphilum TaxID=1684307 RepID=A0A316U107_9BASI|nr:phosphoglycerate mutase-like protein [Pseudomicrostroma glucosiphilum]PWN19082.1 phosphoglycerate mutase-like protein [Pseudomicrostroma glucosiphilum]
MPQSEAWEDVPQDASLSFGKHFHDLLQAYRGGLVANSNGSLGSQGQFGGRRPILRVLMVRHGETAYNVQGIIQGQMDTPLNALGRKQALLTGRALANTPLDAVYSSPLQRTMDTAAAIHGSHPARAAIAVVPDDRLKERAFGSLEGKSYKGKKGDTIPGIEKTQELQDRVASFWNDLIEREAKQAQEEQDRGDIRTVLLVGHGAALSALLEVLTPYALLEPGVQPSRLWNCSITEMAVFLPRLHAARTSNGESSASSWKVKPTHLLREAGAKGEQFERSVALTRWAGECTKRARQT